MTVTSHFGARSRRTFPGLFILILLAAGGLMLAGIDATAPADAAPAASFIIQGDDFAGVAERVRGLGGKITHDLHLIEAVAADLTPAQLQALRHSGDLRITENRTVETAGRIGRSRAGDDEGCLASLGELEPGTGSIKWRITNSGTNDIVIKSIEITWPASNGDLNKIKLGPKKLFAGSQSPTSAFFDAADLSDAGNRTIAAGSTEKLKFNFADSAAAGGTDYLLDVMFEEGCMVSWGTVLDDGFPVLETDYPTRVNADQLHADGITGAGVTVAFVDTGNSRVSDTIHYNAAMQWRYLAQYDAIADVLLDENDFGPANPPAEQDLNGHGGHVTSVALSAKQTMAGNYNGIAPGADLVTIRSFDDKGDGTYADVIRGIQFAVDFQAAYGIRVLNLAFSGPAVSFYWEDPLDQAVTAAWGAGIVVVAAAGNVSPDPTTGGAAAMTVGVPGNNPYAITAGAMSDNFTPGNVNDDFLTSFSAAGPTLDRFVKPELVAPGGHTLGMMSRETLRGFTFPANADFPYFEMAGTSAAAAITSGVVALMLEADPQLSPDDVKCRLLAAARAAEDAAGAPAYSPFQQGAGLIDAAGAVAATVTGCGNPGLDASADLADDEHYVGLAGYSEVTGGFFLAGVEGLWDGTYAAGAFPWNDANPWVELQAGSNANPWVEINANPWVESNPWPGSDLFDPIAVNFWVPAE